MNQITRWNDSRQISFFITTLIMVFVTFFLS